MEAVIIVGVYIATLIGAGFASGSEVCSYFVKFGKISFLGVVLSSILFGYMAYVITKRANMYKYNNFSDYLSSIMPKIFVKLIDKLIFAFMLIVFIAMASGAGEAISNIFNVPKVVGVVLLCLLCLVVFSYDLNGLMAANGALSAIIVVGIVGVCWYLLNYRETSVFLNNSKILNNWFVSSASYVSYNILTASVILVQMGRSMKSSRFKLVGVLSGVTIFVLMMFLWAIIGIYYGKIELGSIPMLTICQREGGFLVLFYSVVLFIAMITTAFSNGFAVIDKLSESMNKKLAIGFVLCIGYFGAGFDFALFVDFAYRILGYLGFIMLFFVIIDGLKIKKYDIYRKTKKLKE